MPLTDDGALARRLLERLRELGVETSQEEAAELASAYPALEAWIAIATDLAADGKLESRDPPSS